MSNATCRFAGCDKPVKVKKDGLCHGHYQQQYHGRELAPLREKRVYAQPTPDTKICTKCMRVLPLSEFYRRVTGIPQSRCKECMIRDNTASNMRRAAKKAAQEALQQG